MKMFRESNLMTVRESTRRNVKYHIEPSEKRHILRIVNEVAYVLYDHYRTARFVDTSDLVDEAVADELGWPARKVAKYRVVLEKAGLILIQKYGTGASSITKLIVGPDIVALAKAGLPDRIQDLSAFKRLKKQLKINSTEDLVNNVELIQDYFEKHPDDFL